MFLRFLLPTFGDRYVEAEIVSKTHRKRQWVTCKTTTVYVYGVRFTGAMADDETLKQGMPTSPADDGRIR